MLLMQSDAYNLRKECLCTVYACVWSVLNGDILLKFVSSGQPEVPGLEQAL